MKTIDSMKLRKLIHEKTFLVGEGTEVISLTDFNKILEYLESHPSEENTQEG